MKGALMFDHSFTSPTFKKAIGEASDHSRIERSYDVDGNFLTEAIYLD